MFSSPGEQHLRSNVIHFFEAPVRQAGNVRLVFAQGQQGLVAFQQILQALQAPLLRDQKRQELWRSGMG
jgi:hypothetical protein